MGALDPLETELGVVVEALAVCLCAQILADELPQTCFCGIVPGSALPLDLVQGNCSDKDGAAFVRLVNTYPSRAVGEQDINAANCRVGQGFDLEVGIFRMFPLTKTGGSPKASVSMERWRLQLADERAMRRAINCCEWLDAEDFVVGMYTPSGPEGGILGGTIPISGWMP